MDQQTEKTMTVKDYKRAGRADAAAYIKRRKETKGEERKNLAKEQKQKIKTWKKELKDLPKEERRLQKKAHKAYKKRMALPRTVAVWIVVLLVIGMIGNIAAPLVNNLSHIMGQKYTDQTPDAQAARAAGEAEKEGIKDTTDREIADLIVRWHYQEVVLPSITEPEVQFDPMDETQVDLTGLPHAPVPTQPAEEAA